MGVITEFLRTDIFNYLLLGSILILLVLYFTNCMKLRKIRKEYHIFLKKLGNGANIEEILKQYMYKAEEINNKNQELMAYCNKLDKDMAACIQKIGIVRYSAFKDMGSDLSFALALLDEENTGVVLNGIYSSEISNIYAKPVTKGTSTYTISAEERQAIDIAMHSEQTHRVRE